MIRRMIKQMFRTEYLEQSVKLEEKFKALAKELDQAVTRYTMTGAEKQDAFREAKHNAQIQTVKLEEKFKVLTEELDQALKHFTKTEAEKQDAFREAILKHNAQIESGLSTLVALVIHLTQGKAEEMK